MLASFYPITSSNKQTNKKANSGSDFTACDHVNSPVVITPWQLLLMCRAAEFKILITKIYEKCALEFGGQREEDWERQQGGMICIDGGCGVTVEGASPNHRQLPISISCPRYFPRAREPWLDLDCWRTGDAAWFILIAHSHKQIRVFKEKSWEGYETPVLTGVGPHSPEAGRPQPSLSSLLCMFSLTLLKYNLLTDLFLVLPFHTQTEEKKKINYIISEESQWA